MKYFVEKDDARHERARYEEVDLSERLIFPGRILVFVWDVKNHWRRIKTCPGVSGIMVDDRERPVIIPHADIAHIQALQFSLSPQPKPKRKRFRRGWNTESDPTPNDEDVLTISTKSYWKVDGEERNRVLDESLGLAS